MKKHHEISVVIKVSSERKCPEISVTRIVVSPEQLVFPFLYGQYESWTDSGRKL